MQKQTEKGVFNCVWEFILKKHKINIYFNFNFICFSKKNLQCHVVFSNKSYVYDLCIMLFDLDV
jgi:hypothetical protein